METTTLAKNNWFETWFDSDYYHILYRERDDEEAKLFIDNLIAALPLEPDQAVLDLACGRGRHAGYLAARGFMVTGLDLSASSIAYARLSAPSNVTFRVHDMREPFGSSRYNVILNLFTSFGYFEHAAQNLLVMQHIAAALQPGGRVVIEYFNPHYVAQHLVHEEYKEAGGIVFQIRKEIQNGFVYKHIFFEHDAREHTFTERVMLITRQQFEQWFTACGLQLLDIFGDYRLGSYREQTSPRMILLAQKPHRVVINNE